jgi:hypothetical protein
MESVNFDDHVVVLVAAITGCVERALLVLAEAASEGVVVGNHFDRGEVAQGEAVEAAVADQEY